jgi:Ala-tRNA(Pro) deacylase
MLSPQQLFARLEQLGIAERTVEHPAVFTVEEATALRGDLPGHHLKNLFLRKKKEQMLSLPQILSREVSGLPLS